MGDRLRLRALAANTDPRRDPPPWVESGNFVVQDTSTAALLVLALESHGFDTETFSTPTIPGHDLAHLHEAFDHTTWSILLRLDQQLKNKGCTYNNPPLFLL